MEQQPDAKKYREVANFLETHLENLMTYSEEVEKLSVPVVGNLQYFPRPAPDVRLLGNQLSLAQDNANEAIEILNVLAELDEGKVNGDEGIPPVPLLLMAQMQSEIMPFMALFDKFNENTENGKKGKTQDEKTNQSEE